MEYRITERQLESLRKSLEELAEVQKTMMDDDGCVNLLDLEHSKNMMVGTLREIKFLVEDIGNQQTDIA